MDTHSFTTAALSGGRTPTYASRDDNVITRQPLSRLVWMMSWANRGDGVLLVLTGVSGLLYALTHPKTDMFSSALLSIYVGGFGALLLRYEFGNPDSMRRDCGFMYTYLGRAAFLLLIANLSWTCAPFGLFAAVLTNANAILSAYVMWKHPAFVEGQVSWTAIQPGVSDESNTVMLSDCNFDPSSVSARDRASR